MKNVKKYWHLMLACLIVGYLITHGGKSAENVEIKTGMEIAIHGKGDIMACLLCHGVDGLGKPASGYPRLAGLNADYMARQLGDFALGQAKTRNQKNEPSTVYAPGARHDIYMSPMAKLMAPSDRHAVAAYYASLPALVLATPADAKLLASGQKIALHGKPEAGVPRCYACHGLDGAGVGSAFPPIIGQPTLYIKNQMDKWKTGARDNDPNALMKSIATKLTNSEKDAVSAYLANTSFSSKD